MKKFAFSISTIVAIGLLFLGVAAAQQSYGQDSQRMRQDQAQSLQDREKPLVRAGDIIGKKIINNLRQELGSVDELLFADSGELRYVILSKASLFGMGGELTPVPFEVVEGSLNLQKDRIVISGLTEHQINNAPKISHAELASLAQGGSGTIHDGVHSYFGQGATGRQTISGSLQHGQDSEYMKPNDLEKFGMGGKPQRGFEHQVFGMGVNSQQQGQDR